MQEARLFRRSYRRDSRQPSRLLSESASTLYRHMKCIYQPKNSALLKINCVSISISIPSNTVWRSPTCSSIVKEGGRTMVMTNDHPIWWQASWQLLKARYRNHSLWSSQSFFEVLTSSLCVTPIGAGYIPSLGCTPNSLQYRNSYLLARETTLFGGDQLKTTADLSMHG